MNDYGQAPPCRHCESIATRGHCGNVQCHWIVCMDCRKISDAHPIA